MTFADIRNIGKRTLPMQARMVPADKPQEFTEMAYQEIEFDAAVPDDQFTLRSLER